MDSSEIPHITIRAGSSEDVFGYLNPVLCIAYGFQSINCKNMDEICKFVVEKLNTNNPTRLIITIVDNIHHEIYHNSPNTDTTDIRYLEIGSGVSAYKDCHSDISIHSIEE